MPSHIIGPGFLRTSVTGSAALSLHRHWRMLCYCCLLHKWRRQQQQKMWRARGTNDCWKRWGTGRAIAERKQLPSSTRAATAVLPARRRRRLPRAPPRHSSPCRGSRPPRQQTQESSLCPRGSRVGEQTQESRLKTVSGYRAGYPAATVTSRQAETLSLSDASWHCLAVQPLQRPAAAACSRG